MNAISMLPLFLIWAGYLTIPLSFIVNKISGLMLWIVNL